MADLPWTVVGLTAAIAAGEVSAAEALEEALARIADRDRGIGAVVCTIPDQARRRVADGLPPGPLHGLPYLLKDLHAEAAGLPLARGSRLWARHAPAPTATSALVARVQAAGAVIVGRTSSPELGLNITTEPVLRGPTRNPWAPSRSAGGSSGGSAAAVAAGMVPAAHASDSGGSIRIPSAWCGTVGFKPTRGTTPLGPARARSWEGLSHEHAITTTVEDTVRLLQATAGPWPGDAHQRPAPDLSRRAGGSLRIALCTDHPGGGPVDDACAAAAADAAGHLRQLGHSVVTRPTPAAFARCGPAMAPVIAAGIRRDVDALDVDPQAEALLEPAVRDLLARADGMSAADYLAAVEELHRVGADITAALSDVDLVLTPTTASTAPPIGAMSTDRSAGELFADIFARSPFAAAANVTGGPALSLPWALDGGGVPVGVQLLAAQGRDADVLGVGAALAGAHPWRAGWDEAAARVRLR